MAGKREPEAIRELAELDSAPYVVAEVNSTDADIARIYSIYIEMGGDPVESLEKLLREHGPTAAIAVDEEDASVPARDEPEQAENSGNDAP